MTRAKTVPAPTSRTPRHPQRRITVGDRTAEVDAALAPLIEALWRLGIDTAFSCEGSTSQGPDLPPRDEPWGYIRFPDVADFRRFLDLFIDTELAERRFHSDRHHRRSTTPSWELAIHVHRNSEFAEHDDGSVLLPARVGFPSSDIEAMTRIVGAAPPLTGSACEGTPPSISR